MPYENISEWRIYPGIPVLVQYHASRAAASVENEKGTHEALVGVDSTEKFGYSGITYHISLPLPKCLGKCQRDPKGFLLGQPLLAPRSPETLGLTKKGRNSQTLGPT